MGKVKKADYEVGDLVLVIESSLDMFLGKVIEVVPDTVPGGFAYHVRVTSRAQVKPPCGTVVTVTNYERMRLRRRGSAKIRA